MIESNGASSCFKRIDRHTGDSFRGDLRSWARRQLTAHRCSIGLYVAEAGTVAEDGDHQSSNVWVAWDGAFPFPVEEWPED